ncbi:hypothetical protein LTR36_010110 [Oleoguttula mirabilis]|uniref:Uncharacterized protein n=1 Tax=Oleoguttula mirabilis TaxID=1507867 RepID=A0AAV9JRX7_9PEZI|nr:hypothetical protein LTR36_010110 [Oleoguttula mirabilis]
MTTPIELCFHPNTINGRGDDNHTGQIMSNIGGLEAAATPADSAVLSVMKHIQPVTSSRNPKVKGSLPDSGSSPSGDEGDPDDDRMLPPIPDDEEEEDSEPLSGTSDVKPSDSSISSQSKNTSPGMEALSSLQRGTTRPQATKTSSKHSVKPSISQSSRWATLPKDVQAYLKYHRDSLSHHHYAFKYDAGDFLKTTFLEIAMNDDSQALLYAVVAFSAYHYAVARGDDRISAFLSYYNKSITMLQQSLTKKRHSVTTLLTILQLATIEEFLGDWVNLLGHQRAAYQILKDLFTPQTIMQDETRRRIISWYIRFDLFAGYMSGGETRLEREWFASCADFYRRQARDRPSDLGARFEEYFATSRLLATDVALLFAGKTKNTVTDEQFADDTSNLMGQFAKFGRTIQSAFTDPSCFVKSFPNAPHPGEEDIVEFRHPGYFYAGEFFTMNFVLIDFWAIELMFKYQLTMAQRQPPPPELTEIALKKCKMFEAVEHSGQGPSGSVLGFQASLGIASLFLPKDKRHTDWCRKKFALIEQHGYIYPANLRERMTEVWKEDVTHWWLPNDEGYPPIIRAIRDFIEYRARMPKDESDTNVRDMSGIFRSLKIEEPEVPEELLGTDTEPDVKDPSMNWESSPEQGWT